MYGEIERMDSPWMASRPLVGSIVLALMLLIGGPVGPTFAQGVPEYYSPSSRTDRYGNARPAVRERRLMGLFANEAQRQAMRGYQNVNRRTNRRGGLIPFALPVDRPWRAPVLRPTSVATIGAYSSVGGAPSSAQRAYRRYGGFNSRIGQGEADNIGGLLARRSDLIQATSMNAPIHRASLERGSPGLLMALPPSVPAEGVGAIEPGAGGVSLEESLRRGVVQSYLGSRSAGWARFGEGRYRRAARSFETATLLEPADNESRVGELFCHLSLGAMRTSVGLLGRLARRDPQPFRHELNVAERYGSPEDARAIRLQTQLFAQGSEGVADAQALYLFVLWHLGDKEAAMTAAKGISRDLAGSVYADWPDMMAEAGGRASDAAEDRP
jgi:hypothetical protein